MLDKGKTHTSSRTEQDSLKSHHSTQNDEQLKVYGLKNFFQLINWEHG